MYVSEYADSHVEVMYITAHTNHELGAAELPHLPLPESVKEEVATKVSKGIPPERIQDGKMWNFMGYSCSVIYETMIQMLERIRSQNKTSRVSLEETYSWHSQH